MTTYHYNATAAVVPVYSIHHAYEIEFYHEELKETRQFIMQPNALRCCQNSCKIKSHAYFQSNYFTPGLQILKVREGGQATGKRTREGILCQDTAGKIIRNGVSAQTRE